MFCLDCQPFIIVPVSQVLYLRLVIESGLCLAKCNRLFGVVLQGIRSSGRHVIDAVHNKEIQWQINVVLLNYFRRDGLDREKQVREMLVYSTKCEFSHQFRPVFVVHNRLGICITIPSTLTTIIITSRALMDTSCKLSQNGHVKQLFSKLMKHFKSCFVVCPGKALCLSGIFKCPWFDNDPRYRCKIVVMFVCLPQPGHQVHDRTQ